MPSNTTTSALDAMVVMTCLLILAGVVAILGFIKVPQENLPILAGLASGIFGAVIAGYIGFRWGATATSNKKPEPSDDH